MKHELDIWPQFYCRLVDGSKTFEVGDAKRGFQQGDTVVFKEYDTEPVNSTSSTPKGYTDSEPLEFRVGYVHILDSREVVFSLLPMPKAKGK